MSQIYTVPFLYPKELKVTELRDLLKKYSVKLEFNFEADHDDPWNHKVSGTLEQLINFHRDIDGPGQSFPVSEFIEFVKETNMFVQL